MKVDEQLEAARRMIEGDDVAPSAKQIAEGAKIVRDLAEKGNCLEAWRYMLECHERGVGAFKTNKFRRAAKEAIARIGYIREWQDSHRGGFASDLSWCDSKTVRDAMLDKYAQARRQRDKFVEDRVKSRLAASNFFAAGMRLGLDWNRKGSMSKLQSFAVIEFATMYDDSDGYVPVDLGIKETQTGLDLDYDAAIQSLSRLRYTWSKIIDMKPGCGLKCRDMLTDEVFFMFERNLSKSPELKNAAIASGVMPVGACFMHTGFSLPIPGGGTGAESVEGMLDGLLDDLKIPRKRPVLLSKAQTASFAAVSIKSWIAAGMEGPVRMEFR